MPHGVIEIPAILIGGQAGLVLSAIDVPPRRALTLTTRLRASASMSSTLIGGVAVMLVWAGMVESFVSQYHQPVIPYSLKIAFGSLEFALPIWFFSF